MTAMVMHLLIIDANEPGIDTIRLAKRRDLRVSFIRSDYRKYAESERNRSIVYDADAVMSIRDSTVEDEVYRAVNAIHSHFPINGAICLLEPCIDVAARVCRRLDIRFTNAVAVDNARDKAKARELLAAAGLRSARHRCVQTLSEVFAAATDIGGPVVVKPQTGYDSLLATVASDPDAAVTAATQLLRGIEDLPPQLQAQFSRGIMVEEYLQGPLVSAELGLRDGQYYRYMLSDHPRAREDECIEVGASMPADLSSTQIDTCFAYAEQVCRVLGFDFGILHVEMIVTSRGPVLVEANSRLMGGVMPALYRLLTGVEIQEFLLDLHLGLPLQDRPPRYAGFVAARNIMPKRDMSLPDVVDLSWHKAFGSDLAGFEAYRLVPRARVRRLDVLGCYLTRGTSFAAANALAERMVTQFEQRIGIPLIR